jgi:Zn-dependent protease with chaperone function
LSPPGDATLPQARAASRREEFFAAQRRHRRGAEVIGIGSGVAIAIAGLPLAAVLLPLALAGAQIVSLAAHAAFGTPDLLAVLLQQGGALDGGGAPWTRSVLLAGALLPGAVVLVLAWAVVLSRLRAIAPEDLALAMSGRLPRGEDAEERQLSNVVAEMALAAAIPAPTVLVLDTDDVNAGLLGTSPERAAVVVTRGLLVRCSRAETQALVATGIATVADGDLRGSLPWTAAFVTLAIARLALRSAVEPSCRRPLRRTLEAIRSRAPERVGRDLFDDLLAAGQSAPADLPGGIVGVLAWPFFMARAAWDFALFVLGSLLVRPILGLLLRRRRYLADALAVQFTRDPASLARALERIVGDDEPRRPLPALLDLTLVLPTTESRMLAMVGLPARIHSLARRHALVLRLGTGERSSTEVPARRVVRAFVTALLASLLAAAAVAAAAAAVFLAVFAAGVGTLWMLLLVTPLRWALYS